MQLLIRRSALRGNVQEFWCKIPLVKEGFTRAAQFAISCNPKSAPTPRYTSNLGGGNARANGNVNFRPRDKPWSSRYELFPAPDGSIWKRAKQSPNGQTVQNQRILYPGVGRDDGKEQSERKSLNAILVLAGGQLTGGGVPEWVRRRLDKALELQIESGPHCKIVCLGGGTPHRHPILTPEGFVIHESNSCAEYLLKQGVQASLILKEWSSYDTIGTMFHLLLFLCL